MSRAALEPDPGIRNNIKNRKKLLDEKNKQQNKQQLFWVGHKILFSKNRTKIFFFQNLMHFPLFQKKSPNNHSSKNFAHVVSVQSTINQRTTNANPQ